MNIKTIAKIVFVLLFVSTCVSLLSCAKEPDEVKLQYKFEEGEESEIKISSSGEIDVKGDLKKEGLLLINEIALKENMGKKVEAKVSIQFSHNGSTIFITRKIAGLMKADGDIVQDPVDQVEFQKT